MMAVFAVALRFNSLSHKQCKYRHFYIIKNQLLFPSSKYFLILFLTQTKLEINYHFLHRHTSRFYFFHKQTGHFFSSVKTKMSGVLHSFCKGK